MSRRSRPPGGFTLIEILVVILIVAILLGILIMAVQNSRETANRIVCTNNMKQIALALANYQSQHGAYPPAYIAKHPNGNIEQGTNWGWAAMTLHHLDYKNIYNSINFQLKVYDIQSYTSRRASISSFICPSAGDIEPVEVLNWFTRAPYIDDLAASSYVSSAGNRSLHRSPISHDWFWRTRNSAETGVMYRNSNIKPSSIKDGLSSTLLLGERLPSLSGSSWVGSLPIGIYGICTGSATTNQECVSANVLVLGHAGPENDNGSPAWVDRPNYRASGADGYSSNHQNGCVFALADGSVRFIKNNISPMVFGALASISGGELVGEY